jgi:hypothetical protein
MSWEVPKVEQARVAYRRTRDNARRLRGIKDRPPRQASTCQAGRDSVCFGPPLPSPTSRLLVYQNPPFQSSRLSERTRRPVGSGLRLCHFLSDHRYYPKWRFGAYLLQLKRQAEHKGPFLMCHKTLSECFSPSYLKILPRPSTTVSKCTGRDQIS